MFCRLSNRCHRCRLAEMIYLPEESKQSPRVHLFVLDLTRSAHRRAPIASPFYFELYKYLTLKFVSLSKFLNSSSPVISVAFLVIVNAAANASAYESGYFAFSLAASNDKFKSASTIWSGNFSSASKTSSAFLAAFSCSHIAYFTDVYSRYISFRFVVCYLN